MDKMNTLHELKTYVRGRIAQYPDLDEEISDLFDLCVSEIEEGGSTQHEINLCHSDIESLIKNRHLE